MNKKILIVEDEALIAQGIEEELLNFGYEITSKVSYGERVQAEVDKFRPDLVLMDIKLKGKMNGIEAAHQIQSSSSIPVVFLTAYDDRLMLEQAKKATPYGFLAKPFRPQELNAAIELSFLRSQIEEDLKTKQENTNQSIDTLTDESLALNSKLKECQKSLIQAQDKAKVADQAKRDFLSRMSHEFRTPLNSILGFSQILQSETNDPLTDSQKKDLKHVIDSANRILQLVNDVLDLDKIEKNELPIKLEEISLNQIIEESFNQIKQSAQDKNLSIIDKIPSNEEIWVSADQKHLKNVLLNLLTNSIKYNHYNGYIELSMEFEDLKKVRLKIRDTGVGIPEDKQSQIFKPFNAINPQTSFEEGIGLGLSISKCLMELMSGNIYFESYVDHGSSFFIELPMTKRAPVTPENNKGTISSIKSFNEMIMKVSSEQPDLSKISIPKELKLSFLEAAEVYNYTRLEDLIEELENLGKEEKLVAKLINNYLNQYNVEKIIEIINKTCKTS
jgi:signal transduction histidine kinase